MENCYIEQENKSKLINNSILNENLNFNAQTNTFFNLIACKKDTPDDLEVNLTTSTSKQNNKSNKSAKRHLNKEQAQFNKFVREEVTKRFGLNFVLQHEVNQLESSVMDLIKNLAITNFLPKNTAPARAWKLAKVSLRSMKRDFKKRQSQVFKNVKT